MNYKKVLDQLIREYPHELDSIERVVLDSSKDNKLTAIDFSDIILSEVWTSDEKVRLLRLFGHNKYEHTLYDDNALLYCAYGFDSGSYSGFCALAETFFEINREIGDKDNIYAFREMIGMILNKPLVYNKGKYINYLLSVTDKNILKELFSTNYVLDSYGYRFDNNLIIKIIETKDLDLINNWIGYVPDINPYLSTAVDTNDIDVVEYFLSLNVDINYVLDNTMVTSLTPLKTAIKNNNFEMFKFLVENGADINLEVDNAVYNDTSNKDVLNKIRFMRESSPVEFATKLQNNFYFENQACGHKKIYFEGEPNNRFFGGVSVENAFGKNSNIFARQKIVNYIFDNMEESKRASVDYTDLLAFTFISKDIDSFKKYASYIVENKIDVDLDRLINNFFDFDVNNFNLFTNSFIEFCKNNNPDFNAPLKLINKFIEIKEQNNINPEIVMDSFIRIILKKLNNDEKKNIPLMPYCKDMKTYIELFELGFDINAVDKTGSTLLINMFKRARNEAYKPDIDLLNYAIRHVDNTVKDKYDKNALYYALFSFNSRVYLSSWEGSPEFRYATLSLINYMTKEDVNDKSIHDAINFRYGIDITDKNNPYVDFNEDKYHFDPLKIEKENKDLFNALLDKGYQTDSVLLEKLFEKLFLPENSYRELIGNTKYSLEKYYNIIGMSTIDFIFQKLDLNTEIQTKNPKTVLNDVYKTAGKTFSPQGFLNTRELLTKLNEQIGELQKFNEEEISNKFDPDLYREYAKFRYNIEYDELQNYFVYIFIKILNGTSEDQVDLVADLLDTCTNFDINTELVNKSVEIKESTLDKLKKSGLICFDENNYEVYDEDFVDPKYYILEENPITFTGNLMQYAILINNVRLTRLLHNRGASYEYYNDGEDCTFDNVNSLSMRKHLELATGKVFSSELEDDEIAYYKKLVSKHGKSHGKKPGKNK